MNTVLLDLRVQCIFLLIVVVQNLAQFVERRYGRHDGPYQSVMLDFQPTQKNIR